MLQVQNLSFFSDPYLIPVNDLRPMYYLDYTCYISPMSVIYVLSGLSYD